MDGTLLCAFPAGTNCVQFRARTLGQGDWTLSVWSNTPGPVPFDALLCAKGVTYEMQARYGKGFPVVTPVSDWSPSIQAV